MARLHKRMIVNIGLILVIVHGILSIVCMVMVGLDFNLTNLTWSKENLVKNLGILQITAVAAVGVFFIIGLFSFTEICIDCKKMNLVYAILELVSGIFSLVISIFAIYFSVIKKSDDTDICKEDYKGFFKNFKDLDYFMYEVDQKLCSDACRCYKFYNYSALESFTQDPYILSEFQYMNINYEVNDVKDIRKREEYTFMNCNNKAKKAVYDNYITKLKELKRSNKLFKDQDEVSHFIKFWRRVEEKFDCTGWCNNKYVANDGNSRKIVKHLFADINRGLPRNREGCMKEFTKWLVDILLVYGIFLMIIGVIQIIIFIFSFLLFLDYHIEGDVAPLQNREPESNKVLQ